MPEINNIIPGCWIDGILRSPDALQNEAIVSPGRYTLNYQHLGELVQSLSVGLEEFGIKPGDGVAMIVPPGADAFIILLAIMRIAVALPLPHLLKESEFDELFDRVRPRLLVVLKGTIPEACKIAREKSLLIAEVEVDCETLSGPGIKLSGENFLASDSIASPDYSGETGLVLLTSATTERPKLVPISHRQFQAMIQTMRVSLPLSDKGRTLIMTPHFHLQSIVSVMMQFASGGTIIATSGFSITDFPGWMQDYHPTQFAANPTILSAILEQCPASEISDMFRSLRFVVCAGATLTDALRDDFEKRLGINLIERYGMTETGGIAMTPVERSHRKAGSVGQCTGIEIGILGDDEQLLPPGQRGEIVVRGETVINAYVKDPTANQTSFWNGWFRTGDLGFLDEDGFLFLTGRKKECINRGAEKILPNEIEAVLSRHPHVKEVAVFGYPHPRLGEDIGACIVPRNKVSAADLRRFSAPFLAEYKIPRLILFRPEIPKNQTGKPLRNRLAELLLPSNRVCTDEEIDQIPLDDFESQLAEIWSELLGVSTIGRWDDFFLLGGDSLLATEMLTRIESVFGCEVSPSEIAVSAKFSDLAALVSNKLNGLSSSRVECLVPLQTEGHNIPLFLAHSLGGYLVCYTHLLNHLGSDRPIFGLQAIGNKDGEKADPSIEAMASRYVDAMKRVQTEGPYFIAGYSMGGIIAVEVARILIERGDQVGGVVIIDTKFVRGKWTLHNFIKVHYKQLAIRNWSQRLIYISDRTRSIFQRRILPLLAKLAGQKENVSDYESKISGILELYELKPVNVRTLLLWCHKGDPVELRPSMLHKWRSTIHGDLDVCEMPGDHGSIVAEPLVRDVALRIKEFISHQTRSVK